MGAPAGPRGQVAESVPSYRRANAPLPAGRMPASPAPSSAPPPAAKGNAKAKVKGDGDLPQVPQDLVLAPGTPRPSFAFPVGDEQMVGNVISREIIEPQVQHVIPEDPTIAVLDKLVRGILDGTDLSDVKPEVTRILSSQKDKARIVQALVANHDFHRINLLLRVRARQERLLYAANQRGDLSVHESMALFRLADTALAQVTKSIGATDDGGGGNGPSVVDSAATTLDKVDATRHARDNRNESKFTGTTPHGREIVRRRLYALKQSLIERGGAPEEASQ